MLLQLLGFVAGLALVFIYAQRYLRRRNLCLENGCLPPPKMRHRDRIFGIDTMAESYQHVCDKTYLHECVSRFEKYGWTYEQRITGTTMINTCEPANVKAILGTQFTNFTLGDRRKNAFVPLLGHGIFTTDGSPWSHSRSVLRPSFAKDHISNIAVLDKHVSNLITAIEHRQRHHGSCDIRSFFFSLTLDVATELFFGASCQSLRSAAPSEDEESARFAEAFNRGQQKIAEDFALGSLAALRPRANKEFKADRDVIHGFIDSYVERAVAKATRGKQLPDDEGYESDDKKSYIVLDEMAKQTSDVKQLRSELLNLMLAARDTTASLLSNLFFILARRPDVWSKLKAEVDTLNGEQPEFSKLKDMKYLQYCMKECTYLPTHRQLCPYLWLTLHHNSPPHAPSYTPQLSHRHPRYSPPPWRRPRRHRTPLRPRRPDHKLQRILHAPPIRPLEKTQRVQTPALGRHEDGLGIPTLQWRTKGLSRP